MALVINSTDLQSQDKLQTVATQPDLTDYQSVIQNAISSVPELQKTVDSGTTDNKKTLSTLETLYRDLGKKGTDTATANESFGVNAEKSNYDRYNQDLNDINANISGLKKQASAIPLQVQQNNANTGATDAGVAPQTTGMLRDNAIKALTQSALADITTANINNSVIRYNAAKDKVSQAIDLKYIPIENEIKQLKEQMELNQKFITDPAEKKLAEANKVIVDERARLLEEQKKNEKDVNDVRLQLINNGKDDSIINGAKTLSEAIDMAGSALRTPNNEIVKLGDNQAYLIDKNTGKIIRQFGGGGGGNGTGSTGLNIGGANGVEYKGIVDTILASGKFTKDQATTIRNAINNGEDPLAVIKNNAKNIMGAAESSDLAAAERSLDSMKKIEDNLKEFYALGGSSGIFKGKYEKVVNKLGEVKDPALAALAVQIQLDLQQYRKDISGTAFGIQEGADIASVFPGINKGEILNNIITKKRVEKLESTINSTYKNVLGGAYENIVKVQNKSSVSKDGMADKDFVAKAMQSPEVKSLGGYQNIVNSTPAGHIPVVENSTGKVWYVTPSEFNSSTYTYL